MIYFRQLQSGQIASFFKADGRCVVVHEVRVTPEELVAVLRTITNGRENDPLVVLLRGFDHGRYVLSMTSTKDQPFADAPSRSLRLVTTEEERVVFEPVPAWLVDAVNGIAPHGRDKEIDALLHKDRK